MRPLTRGVFIATLLVVIVAFGLIYHQRRRNDATNVSSGATASSTAMAGMNMNENGAVKLTAQQIAQFGVTFGVVEQRTLTDETRATGVVTFDETKLTQIAPRIGGFVEHLYVDATGQPVRRGQPLLDL